MILKFLKITIFIAAYIFISICPYQVNAEQSDEKIISDLLKVYLENKVPQAQESAKKAIQRMSKTNANPAAIAILQFLSGKKVKAAKISLLTEKSADLWGLAVLVMFAREIKEVKDYYPEDLEYYLNNYEVNLNSFLTKETKSWASRVSVWKTWITDEYPSGTDIEPLLLTRSKRVPKSFMKMPLDEYVASRKSFEKRPKPMDLVFDEKIIQGYLNSLTKEEKKDEKRRFDYIREAKDYLVRLFERTTYYGPIKGNSKIKIRKGSVSMANKTYFSIKRGTSRRGRLTRCYWKDLKFEQYINFFCFFASKRAKITFIDNKKSNPKAFAAEDYRLLSALCDWYGEYEEAMKYAKMSVELYPKVEDSINRLILGGD